VQTAAFQSWRRAFPSAEVLLFGDVGSWQTEMARLAMQTGGPLPAGKKGGELISWIFQTGAKRAGDRCVLYLNSDIFLEPSSSAAVAALRARPGPWLASARRWSLSEWTGPSSSYPPPWDVFFEKIGREGRWGEACALDLFLFRGLSFEDMPPFFIGHRGWDNWMILHARQHGIPVLDLSRCLRAVHFDHDYSYAKGNSAPSRRDGPLEEANLRMLGGDERLFHLGHATHEWREGAVHLRKGLGVLQRNLELWQINHPGQRWWWRPLRHLLHPLLKAWQIRTTRDEDWNSPLGRIPAT